MSIRICAPIHTNHPGEDLEDHNENVNLFEKNNLPELGVTDPWLVVFHAVTSLRVSECL